MTKTSENFPYFRPGWEGGHTGTSDRKNSPEMNESDADILPLQIWAHNSQKQNFYRPIIFDTPVVMPKKI